MIARRIFVAFGLCLSLFLVLALLAGQTGCQRNSSADTQETAETAPANKTAGNATQWLETMLRTYREATTYEDAGEIYVAVQNEQGQRDESGAIPFSVTFERPNKVRIHSLEANIVCDGKHLWATINSLSGQVLQLPAPAKLTPGDITSDGILIGAMRGQLDTQLPQLVLLLETDPIRKLVGAAQPVALEDATFGNEKCHRVAFSSPQGDTVFWISPNSHLLVKYELPSTAFKERFQLAKAAMWAEFNGARVNSPIASEAFKIDIPTSARLLNRFLPPPPVAPSAMLGKTIDDFRLTDYRGGAVTRESLAGKVAVLDMWATWCGWCFKGFPNLQQVYNEFETNDKVAILAVNKDDPTVSDEEVKKSFLANNLTIPIARDEKQVTDAVFQVPGLPTMVILGPTGIVEEHHVGFDEHLAETLPKKLAKLLAGESLAKEELERYQQAKDLYDKQAAEAKAD